MAAVKYRSDTTISDKIRQAKEGDVVVFENNLHGTVKCVTPSNPKATVLVVLDIKVASIVEYQHRSLRWFDINGEDAAGFWTVTPELDARLSIEDLSGLLKIQDIISRVSIKDLKPGTFVRLRDGSIECIRGIQPPGVHTFLSNNFYYCDNGVCNIDLVDRRNSRDIIEILKAPTPEQSTKPVVSVEVPLSEYLSFFDDDAEVTLPVRVLKELV